MKDKAKQDFNNRLKVDLVFVFPMGLGGLAATQSLSGLVVGGAIGFGLDVWNALGQKKFKAKNPTPQQ